MVNQGRFPFDIVNNILIGEETPTGNYNVNIGKLILNTLKSRPDFVAQVDATTGKEVTFQEIQRKSVKLAIWMKNRGVRPGDMIGISANHHGVTYVFLASLYIGAIPVLWHERHIYNYGKLIVTNNVLKMMFIHDIFATMLNNDDNISTKQPLPTVVVFGILRTFITYDTLESTVDLFYKQKAVDEFNCVKLNKSRRDTAVILYTRATTNITKGVKIPHTTFIAPVNQQVFNMLPDGMGMWVGSFSSFINLILTVHSILSYKKMIGFVGNSKEEVCQAIQKYKVDWILLETYMCRDMVNSKNLFTRYNLSSLKMLMFTGSPISYDDRNNLIQSLPKISIISLYSTTETGIISCQAKIAKIKSSGYVGKNIRLKIIDLNNEEPLGPYMSGEIWCKCKNIMNVCHNYYQQTEELTDENGWHHTGDLGYYDEDGEIFVLERVSNFIFFKELKFSPTVIENVISRHNAIENVAVVGMTDEDDYQHAFAFISTKPGMRLNIHELMDEVVDKLCDCMRLRGGVKLLLEMPYTLSGNIDRVLLRQRANEYKKAMAQFRCNIFQNQQY